MVLPERFRKMGYYYEMEKEVFKLKPQGKAPTNFLEHMFREEVVRHLRIRMSERR